MARLSEKLKRTRTELGITQGELAEAADLSLRSIFAYERGEKYPREGTILKLAKALRVSSTYLSDDSCENPMQDIEQDTFIEEARSHYGSRGSMDIRELLQANEELFAGGEVSEDQKEEFFQAVMAAYLKHKDAARQTFSRKTR